MLIYEILFLLSGLGVFLYGIHNISKGMEKVANASLRKNIYKFTKSPIRSFNTGLVTTLMLENSSVTSVLVVGILNAGLISLYQGLSMIIGANVGASFILILFCFDTFKIVDVLALSVLVGGVMMLFAKSSKTMRIAKTIAGFGMLFCGLKMMSLGMDGVMNEPGAHEFVANIKNIALLLGIGLVFGMTFHVLGTTALLISILTLPQSPITLQYCIIIVLGANVGSTISGVLASLKSNIHAKRAAIFNVFLNVFASALMFALIMWTPLLNWVNNLLVQPSFVFVAIIILLNVLTAVIVMPFLKPIEKFMLKLVKERKKDNQNDAFNLTEQEFHNTIACRHQILSQVIIVVQSMKELYIQLQNAFLDNKNFKKKFTIQKLNKIKQYRQDVTNNILRASSFADAQTLQRLNAYNSSMLEIQALEQSAEKLLEFVDKPSVVDFSKSEADVILSIFVNTNKFFNNVIEIFSNESSGVLPTVDVATMTVVMEDEFGDIKAVAKKVLLKNFSVQSKREHNEAILVIFSQLERVCDHLTNLVIKSI